MADLAKLDEFVYPVTFDLPPSAAGGNGSAPTPPLLRLLDGISRSAFLQNLDASQCILIAILTTPIILAFSSKSLIRQGLYPVQLFFLVSALLAKIPAAKSQADTYNLGLLIGTWGARIIDRVYMHEPERTFLRKGIDDEPGQGPNTYGIFGKAFWGLELITAAKGIGWNWQVGGIPRPDHTTRLGFVTGRLSKWLFTFFLIHLVDLTSTAILKSGNSDDSPWTNAVLQNTWFLRFFMTAGWLTVVYGHITLPENLVAIVFVASGIGGRWSDPTQWPPAFGSISESYTLRRCWGKFWHAALRRSTNAPGEWLLQMFPGLRRPKSQTVRLLRRYGILFLAFVVSGLIHAAGSFLVTRDSPAGPSDGGAFVYFLAQPLGILLEDAVLNLLGVSDGGAPGLFRRLIGYLYVGGFWIYTFPHLKVVPLAVAHGLDDGCGSLMAGVKACRDLAQALPFNPARMMMEELSR